MAKRNGSGGKPRGPRTKSDVPGAKALAGIGHNSSLTEKTEAQVEEGWHKHRTKWNEVMAAKALTDQRIKECKAALKADGYTVKQMQIADDLESISGEEKLTKHVEAVFKVAKWQGHPLAKQLDLFGGQSAAPGYAERAFDAGRRASMQDQPRKPPHSPESEEYKMWMEGYASHQAELAENFKKQVPKKARKRAEKVVAEEDGANAPPVRFPTAVTF